MVILEQLRGVVRLDQYFAGSNVFVACMVALKNQTQHLPFIVLSLNSVLYVS